MLISVIVPVYNSEKTLRRCVRSITSQSYREIEILLVDDGSSDRSPQIALQLAGVDDRVRCLSIPHSGVSVARNTGLECCSGKRILFVDSDDCLVPGMIERMAACMERTDADLVTCDIERTADPERSSLPPHGREELCSRDDYLRLLFRIGSNEWVHYPVAKLYRKEFLPEQLFPPGIRVGEDVVATYRAVANTRSIVRIREVGYLYVTNPDSATGSFTEKDFDLLQVWDLVVRSTRGLEPDATYARLNRGRVRFTLLFRLITEVSASDRREKYALQEKQLLAELREREAELLCAPVAISRKFLIVLLCHFYGAASCLGSLSVKVQTIRGAQTGFFRRKLS